METIITHVLNEAGIPVKSIEDILYYIETNKAQDIYEKGVLPLSYLKYISNVTGLYTNSFLKTDKYVDNNLTKWVEKDFIEVKEQGTTYLLANKELFEDREYIMEIPILEEVISLLKHEIFIILLNELIKKVLPTYTPKVIAKGILIKKIHINHTEISRKLHNKRIYLTGTSSRRACFMGLGINCNVSLYRVRFVDVQANEYTVLRFIKGVYKKRVYHLTRKSKDRKTLAYIIYKEDLKHVTK